MEVSVQVKWNAGAKEELQGVSDKILYATARMTLDYADPHIPFNTGKMEKTSMRQGVQGSKGKYYIGSYTDYASKVWGYNNVNWTNPDTYPQWFKTIYNEKGKTILQNAIERYKLK